MKLRIAAAAATLAASPVVAYSQAAPAVDEAGTKRSEYLTCLKDKALSLAKKSKESADVLVEAADASCRAEAALYKLAMIEKYGLSYRFSKESIHSEVIAAVIEGR